MYFFFFSNELRIVAGLIIILFSLQMIGFLNLKFLNSEKRINTNSKYKDNFTFPYLVGAAFAFGWTPCIGPVLGSIIALSAAEATVGKGILLLSFYSLGLAIPFIALASRFVVNDTTIQYVAAFGGDALPLKYRFAATWAARWTQHEATRERPLPSAASGS